MNEEARAHGKVGIFSEGLAGALAYLTFIPGVIFLLVNPYNKDRFVRFHSFQSIFLWVAGFLIGVAFKLVGFVLLIIPVLGHLLVWLISIVLALAAVLIWVVLVIKALQGETFRLPVIGDLAEQQAGAF